MSTPASPKIKGHDNRGHHRRKQADRVADAELVERARKRILSRVVNGLTPQLIEAVEAGVLAGNYPRVVARSLGVPETTFDSWMDTGQSIWMEHCQTDQDFTTAYDPTALKVELYHRVSQAFASWEVDTVAAMTERIKGQHYWQGHMTMLERRNPQNWGRREVPPENVQRIEDMVRDWEQQRRAARAASGAVE